MNGLDYVVITLIAIGATYGASHGVLRILTSTVSLVAALYVASAYYPGVAAIAEHDLGLGATPAAVAGYVALFASVFMLVELIGNAAIKVLHTAHLGWADRFAGAAVGAAVTGAVAGLMIMLLAVLLPSGAGILRESKLAPRLLTYNNTLVRYIPSEVKDQYQVKRASLMRYWLESETTLDGEAASSPAASPSQTR